MLEASKQFSKLKLWWFQGSPHQFFQQRSVTVWVKHLKGNTHEVIVEVFECCNAVADVNTLFQLPVDVIVAIFLNPSVRSLIVCEFFFVFLIAVWTNLVEFVKMVKSRMVFRTFNEMNVAIGPDWTRMPEGLTSTTLPSSTSSRSGMQAMARKLTLKMTSPLVSWMCPSPICQYFSWSSLLSRRMI